MEIDCGRDIGKMRSSVSYLCKWFSPGLARGLGEDGRRLDRGSLCYPLDVRQKRQKIGHRTSAHTSGPCLRDIVTSVGVMERGGGR